MDKQKKLFVIDTPTKDILEGICYTEGISASEFLRLTIRAWRCLEVYERDNFGKLTSWTKAKATAQIVKKELNEMKSV